MKIERAKLQNTSQLKYHSESCYRSPARLDYQPLFGKWAWHERLAEIVPTVPHSTSLLRSRSGRSHVTLPVPTRLLQTGIHSFLGNKPINVWLLFSCECSRLWLVQRIQWQLNERLIGPNKQKRKTPRKECMSVWSSRVGTGSVTWLRP